MFFERNRQSVPRPFRARLDPIIEEWRSYCAAAGWTAAEIRAADAVADRAVAETENATKPAK